MNVSNKAWNQGYQEIKQRIGTRKETGEIGLD